MVKQEFLKIHSELSDEKQLKSILVEYKILYSTYNRGIDLHPRLIMTNSTDIHKRSWSYAKLFNFGGSWANRGYLSFSKPFLESFRSRKWTVFMEHLNKNWSYILPEWYNALSSASRMYRHAQMNKLSHSCNQKKCSCVSRSLPQFIWFLLRIFGPRSEKRMIFDGQLNLFDNMGESFPPFLHQHGRRGFWEKSRSDWHIPQGQVQDQRKPRELFHTENRHSWTRRHWHETYTVLEKK